MVFNGGIVLGLAIVFFVWMMTLSVVVIRMRRHYNRLTQGVTNLGLKDVLDGIIQQQAGSTAHLQKLESGLRTVYASGKLHIQRIGIVRFNPFSDTGGAQSFTLALLDGHSSGIIMTSLYARTGNRWYVKEIQQGKGKEVELSREEQQAITTATRIA